MVRAARTQTGFRSRTPAREASATSQGPGNSQTGHGPNLDAASHTASRTTADATFRTVVVIAQFLAQHSLDLGGQMLLHARGEQRHVAIFDAPRSRQVDVAH